MSHEKQFMYLEQSVGWGIRVSMLFLQSSFIDIVVVDWVVVDCDIENKAVVDVEEVDWEVGNIVVVVVFTSQATLYGQSQTLSLLLKSRPPLHVLTDCTEL